MTTLANGNLDSSTEAAVPQNSGIDEGAGNAAAESNWDTNVDISASQEWVEVTTRDVAETETGTTATIGATSNTQSWADESAQQESPKAEVSFLASFAK